MEKIWTVLSIIQWGTQYFDERGVDSPRLTIELILGHVVEMSRVQLYTSFEKPLAKEELEILRSMVKRRVNHEPLQYILGETNFFGLTIGVNPSVLIPRPETEELVEHALKALKSRQGEALRVLDIGTGSGCIALALAKHLPAAHILGIDSSETALQTAAGNARRLGVSNVTFSYCDILRDLPAGEFDVIVSNPPYIAAQEMAELQPEIREHEPQQALTDAGDGYGFYRRFAEVFREILDDSGAFFIEIGFGQAEMVRELFAVQGFDVEVRNDMSSIPRVVVSVAVKGE